VIGVIFASPTGAGLMLVPASVLVGFAGQMGDIAESAVKRLREVKDSSNLIPGHGGVLDRFDAMLGAALVALILWGIGLLPGVT
jgi:phosphatidate cytidylyltransferase